MASKNVIEFDWMYSMCTYRIKKNDNINVLKLGSIKIIIKIVVT